MRKRIAPAVSAASALHEQWLDVEGLAEIEVTSESATHPIEAALLPGYGDGWRAAAPGRQRIRIIFDSPQHLRSIHLVFVEEHTSRHQEFVLRWYRSNDPSPQEIVRQKYHFTPVASEVEDYTVDLPDVAILELEIDPGLQGQAVASLTEFRIR